MRVTVLILWLLLSARAISDDIVVYDVLLDRVYAQSADGSSAWRHASIPAN